MKFETPSAILNFHYWQHEIKRRALVAVIFRPNTAVVRLDDRSADRQSHPQPFALGGEKRLEDLIELIARQTRPVITDRNPKHVRTVQFRPQQNVPLVRRAISHRVKRVEQKIEQDLLQLNLVAARAGDLDPRRASRSRCAIPHHCERATRFPG